MYGKLAVRPSAAFACTQIWYEVENDRPVTVAVCWVESVAAVHKVGAVKPYAIREGTDSLVCHAIVALNGVSETVCTSEISIGVVFTGAGVVVVVGGGVVEVVCPPPSLGVGSTANVRGEELNVTISPLAASAAGCDGAAAAEDEKCECSAGSERGWRPGCSSVRARRRRTFQ
jgi:hypothetical protein